MVPDSPDNCWPIQLLFTANTTVYLWNHCILQSIPLLCHDLMMNCLICPRNCLVVTLELTQLLHYVACRAAAPVCFFVSNCAEPTNCERNLSAPVAVYYVECDEWKRRLFFVNSLAEKSQDIQYSNNKKNMSCVISFVQQQLCIYEEKKTVSSAFVILCNVGSRSFGWSATSSKNL